METLEKIKRIVLFAMIPGALSFILVPPVTMLVEGRIDMWFTIYIAVGATLGMGLFMTVLAIVAPKIFAAVQLIGG